MTWGSWGLNIFHLICWFSSALRSIRMASIRWKQYLLGVTLRHAFKKCIVLIQNALFVNKIYLQKPLRSLILQLKLFLAEKLKKILWLPSLCSTHFWAVPCLWSQWVIQHVMYIWKLPYKHGKPVRSFLVLLCFNYASALEEQNICFIVIFLNLIVEAYFNCGTIRWLFGSYHFKKLYWFTLMCRFKKMYLVQLP